MLTHVKSLGSAPMANSKDIHPALQDWHLKYSERVTALLDRRHDLRDVLIEGSVILERGKDQYLFLREFRKLPKKQ